MRFGLAKNCYNHSSEGWLCKMLQNSVSAGVQYWLPLYAGACRSGKGIVTNIIHN